MSELEGDEPLAPSRQNFAYLNGELSDGFADHGGIPLRQDTADGDVIETSFATDLVTLRRQLREKEQVAERAIRASLELRNELTAVRAEATALKETVQGARKADAGARVEEDAATSSRLVGDVFAELAKVRTESFKARKELERERQEHRAEMIHARAQYGAAQDELQRLIKVRQTNNSGAPQAPKPPVAAGVVGQPPPAGMSRAIVRKLSVAVVAVAFAVCGTLVWRRYPFLEIETGSGFSQTRAPAPPEVRPPKPVPRRIAPVMTPDDILFAITPYGSAQFQGSVARLSHSLSGHFGKSPEEILREVHEKYKANDPDICAFDWRNGQPSLRYAGGRLSISQTIQKCADAVERSR